MANIENEIDNAFKVVGIFVEATILSYKRDGMEHEASELENAYEVLNNHFNNKLKVFNNIN